MKYTGNLNRANKAWVKKMKDLTPLPLVATDHEDYISIDAVQQRCVTVEEQLFES